MAANNYSNPPENDLLDLVIARSVLDQFGGLAKSSRYLARILPSNTANFLSKYSGNIRDLSYLVDAAEFPGRGFMTTDLRYYGTNFKMPYQTSYEDLNLTFICRDDFGEREFFDTWMEIINPVSTYDFSYRSQYDSFIELYQMSDLDPGEAGASSAQYTFRFENAYPVLVNPQPVTWADDNFHRLTVTFTYTRWYRPGIDQPNASGSSLVNGANINNVDGSGPQLYNTNFTDNTARQGRR